MILPYSSSFFLIFYLTILGLLHVHYEGYLHRGDRGAPGIQGLVGLGQEK